MAIERRPAPPRHDRPDLVERLVDALDHPKARGGDVPDIIEQEQAYGGKLIVWVIWTQWAVVGHDERTAIIFDAYQKGRGDTVMLSITLAQGFTPEEADRHNIRVQSQPGDGRDSGKGGEHCSK